jgi:hypothetical protein
MDFQDIYHNRRPDNSISRLASIRQSPREDDEDRVRPSGDEQLNEKTEKRQSLDSSSSRRAWRPRSRSTNRGSMSNVV